MYQSGPGSNDYKGVLHNWSLTNHQMQFCHNVIRNANCNETFKKWGQKV